MTSGIGAELWRKVSSLLDEALELESGERAAFLDCACAGDPILRAHVDTLLRSAEEAGDFLERPAMVDSDTLLLDLASDEQADSVASEGQLVGPYRLVRRIGSGGMGVVWLSERADGQFAGQVALKLIKRGLDTDEILARFLRERQILATLRHPNVAALLDGGVTADGRPWFAMEHVDGQPITLFCDARRARIEDRIRLFRTACEVVQHAHRNLVVHRDLKPSNILVDAEGHLKLLDFGIAKLLDPDVGGTATRNGPRPLTPEYAAPEQMLGEPITTATDVYGLGLVLYELLAGRRPFEVAGSSPEQIRKAVTQTPAARPSSVVGDEAGHLRGTTPQRVRRRLRGDLDTIVEKALRKDPQRRYSSAEAMGLDLDRHLAGLPIAARAETWSYRTGRFIVRNKLPVGAAVVVLLVLISGLGTTLWQARATAREAAKAAAVKDFILSIFAVSDPSQSLGEAITARELLDRGARRIDEELESQPEVQAEMRGVVGNLYLQLGLYGRSGPMLREALKQKQVLYGESSAEAAGALERLGSYLIASGNLDEAVRVSRQAVDLQRLLLGPQHPDLAESLGTLGVALSGLGRYEEAAQSHREALAIDRKHKGTESQSVATDLSNLATVLWKMEKLDEAEPLQRQSLEMRRRLIGENHPDVAVSLNSYASLLTSLGRYDEAESLLRDAVAIYRKVGGDNYPDLAFPLASLGLLCMRRGELDRAKEFEEQALDIRRRVLGDGHPELAASLNNLGTLSYRLKQYDDAERYIREALGIWSTNLGPEHPHVVTATNNLGMILRARGNLEEAEELVRAALALRRRINGEEHTTVSQSLRNLGAILMDRGAYAEALSAYSDSLAVARAAYPERHPRIAEVLADYGGLLMKRERHQEAQPLLEEALAIRVEKLGEDNALTIEVRRNLAACRGALARPRP